jgi:dihydropteroate synthase-like protein
MSKNLLFLTGSLAETGLRRVLEGLGETGFGWEVRSLGLKVAALMTGDMILRRLGNIGDADEVILPGRCRGDLATLGRHFGVPFVRGPEELRDLPEWLGRGGQPVDLSRQNVLIFAEIVDAARIGRDQILDRATRYQQDGADVIDLGCLPEQPFPHLAETVRDLKQRGFRVSVDSMNPAELLTGGQAGADYLLSLTEDSLWITEQVTSTPVLIPAAAGNLDSLERAWRFLQDKGRAALIDPILDPIHFGFVESIVRYHEIRRRLPEAQIMMGVGNLTELTEADTSGINALLFGMISELDARAVLTTEVSPHCRSAVREADLARRIMFRAREECALPKQWHGGLAGLHERKPFPYDTTEIRAAAAAVKDLNYRIQVNEDGIHIYNRERMHSASDPFDLYPYLGVESDGGHAFYLGVELARAEIAHQLGKRFTQDKPLGWGVAVPEPTQDMQCYAAPASTKRIKAAKK